MILCHIHKSSDKACPIAYHLLNFKCSSRSDFTFLDYISLKYTQFVTIINLILIVTVTPSIVNPGPVSQTMCNSVKISYCNIQGLVLTSTMRGRQPIFQTNKLLEFQTFLHSGAADIVIVNETWLNEFVLSNEIVNENYYKTFRLDRTQADKNKYNKIGGGGLLILVKQGISIETKLIDAKCEAPVMSIEIKFEDKSKICLSTFYRYGYSSIDIFTAVEKYFRALLTKYKKFVLIGDLNLSSVEDWDNPHSTCSLEALYIDLFNDLGLSCLINSPTHREGNVLDLLLTNWPGIIKDIVIEPDHICHSDHFAVSFKVKKNMSRKKPVKRKVFKYSEADWDGLSADLRGYNWGKLFANKNINQAWELFKSKIDIAMRRFIPMKSVKFRYRPPWFDDEIMDMSKTKDRLHKIYKHSRNEENKERFTKYRTMFKNRINEKKHDFVVADPCESYSSVSKKFWSHVKSNNASSRIPESVHYKGKYRSNTHDQCEIFNNFFTDQCSDASNYNIAYGPSREFDSFRISSSTVFNFLKMVKPKKAPGPDGISGYILKHCASSLSYPLTLLFNLSYSTGNLPQDWKNANVVPIHKKGKKDDVQNYRPVSLTSLVIKILEKCIRDLIYEKCKDKISPHQHGFLPSRSCNTQMLLYTDFLAININNKLQTDIVYFDFSNAFGSVSHDVILEKLKYNFNIDGFLLRFLTNYLQDRKQSVTINNEFSSPSHVKSGVPQGSILGPLLFVLFINDIDHNINKDSNIWLYADDMKLARKIITLEDHQKLQDDVDSLFQWSIKNKMKFHPKKCKVLTSTLKKSPSDFAYHMCGVSLEKSKMEKDLGIIVSGNLGWNKHQNFVVAKASQKLGLLRRSCSFSKAIQNRKILYLAIVRSQFEHCSQIWRPTNNTQLSKFQTVQKRAVKWILGEDFHHYSREEYLCKLKDLDLLPMTLKFDLNDLVLFHNIIYEYSIIHMPDYLIKKDHTNQVNNRYFTRQTRNFNSSDRLKFKSTIVPRVDAFANSFFHRTYLKWNKLPQAIREIEHTNLFKSKLKEHLWTIAEETLNSL